MKAIRALIAVSLIAHSALSLAMPRQMITHNKTDVESNAYVAGTIPSRYPTKAHSDGSVVWTEVRLACYGHTVNNKCSALVKMATGKDDGGQPVDLGVVTIDLTTGAMSPSRISGNGYTLIVNGPAEATIIKD